MVDLAAHVASELNVLLDGVAVGARLDVPPAADICSSLERWLPEILRRKYPQWKGESLDGICVARATKTGPLAARLIGTCILITDQRVTPFWVDLKLTATEDSVVAFRLRLGEPGTGRLGISGPGSNSNQADRLLCMLLDRLDEVDWTYRVKGRDGGQLRRSTGGC